MEKVLYKIFYELEDTNWWFVATRTYFLKLIKKYIQTPRPRILDAGCGTGGMLKALQALGTAQGIDISEEAIKYCRKRGLRDVQLGSLTQLPFQNNSFDLVLALDVIEHIKDDKEAISEIARVLRPQGIAVLSVPAHQMLWSQHDNLNLHYRRYSMRIFISLLRSYNFQLIQTHYFGLLTLPPLIVSILLERLNLFNPGFFVRPLPKWFNTLLKVLYDLDLKIMATLKPPFGTSIVTIAQVKKQ